MLGVPGVPPPDLCQRTGYSAALIAGARIHENRVIGNPVDVKLVGEDSNPVVSDGNCIDISGYAVFRKYRLDEARGANTNPRSAGTYLKRPLIPALDDAGGTELPAPKLTKLMSQVIPALGVIT